MHDRFQPGRSEVEGGAHSARLGPRGLRDIRLERETTISLVEDS